jgi:hypothetical protein
MRKACATIFLAALALASVFQGTSDAQRETPLEVGILGGVPGPVRPTRAPREIASLLPQKAQVRVVEHTRMEPSEETTVLYDLLEHPKDDPKWTERNTHVVVFSEGKIVKDFGTLDEDCDLGGFEQLRLQDHVYGAVIAFRCAGDRAASDFFLLHANGAEYAAEQIANAGTGKLEILETDPAEVRVWSADVDGVCVWCEQHYSQYLYVWQDGKFALKSTRVTNRPFIPIEVTRHPLVRPAVKTKSSS